MEIRSKQPTAKAPADRFTGDVWIDSIVQGKEPSRIRVNVVHFTPGARTAWHSHALGQTLYVSEGAALVHARGGETVHVHAGDIVYTPPDEWHWHGATPDDFMTHLSMTEGVGESQKAESQWGALVTDSEYHDETP